MTRALTEFNKVAAMWLAYSTDSAFQKSYKKCSTFEERDALLLEWCMQHNINVEGK